MDLYWSVLTRVGQTAVEASSTFLVGIIVAAVMRRMLGSAGTRKLFSGTGLKGLFRAWFIGSLLPVCSFGVIPVAREMKRAGVRNSTILAFILAAPQLNPLSFLYGLTLSEPIMIICFVFATMTIAIVGGEIWKRLFEKNEAAIPIEDEAMPPPGIKRLAAVLITSARETVGPSLYYVKIGILCTGLFAGMMPHGSLSMTMRHDDFTSPALMTLIGVPMYSGVLPSMMRIGLIIEHGNSTGAAFALFELGVGLNIGLIMFLFVQFGFFRVLLWLSLVILLSLGIAYGVEYPLYFAKEEASHTHAFDDWTSPFLSEMEAIPDVVGQKILEKVEVLEPVAIVVLLFWALLGLGLLVFDSQKRLEKWFTTISPPSDRPTSIWNRGVPGPVLGIISLLGLVAFSVVALFIYYPDRDQAFVDIVQTRTEAISAVRSGNKEEAIRRIQQWDLLTRKLQVGVFLRTGRMQTEATEATEALREDLEELRDALLADDLTKAKELLPKVEETYRKFRSHYPPKK